MRTIPVGLAVEGLYFLHGTAYTYNDLVAAYQIQYADGQTEDVAVRKDENIRDWATEPAPFLRERGTRSIVAWRGACPMFRAIGVYRMLWVNPRPGVPVKAVRFSNPTRETVPVLMGLTAAVASDRAGGPAAGRGRA